MTGEPSGWRDQLLVLAGILTLTGLDLAATVLAKEWALHRRLLVFLAGLACSWAIYFAFAFSLHIATLTVVAIAWTGLAPVGAVLLDKYRYGTRPGLDHWVVVALLVAGVLYLLLRPPAGTDL
jgi:multidrug transporter EmrE-like cation transporter